MAPSLLPHNAGARVTTDRRDAVPRARLRRAGALTPVDGPTVAAEAMRDLTRARADTLRDLKAAKFRLNAFLLRHDLRYTGRATGGPAPRRGLSAVVGATPAPPIVFQEDVRAVNEHTERLPRLAPARHEPGQTWCLQPLVEVFQALRGVPCTVAVTIVADLGALTRLDHPRQLMRSWGLPPAAYSSGERRRPGAITKTGHPPARRALVEGAWASRYPANVRRHRHLRLEQLPQAGQDSSWTAHVRLCTRYRKLSARGKPANQVVVASARELLALMWAMAKAVALIP